MSKLDIIGDCLDQALVQSHHQRIRKQVFAEGEKAKVIAFGRLLPRPLLKGIMQLWHNDRAPFLGEREITPIAFGCETLVYDAVINNKKYVIKRRLIDAEDAREHVVAQARSSQIMAECLGDIAVPEHYVLAESPYRTGTNVVMSIQEKMEGNDYFADKTLADPYQVARFLAGTRTMFEKYGRIPDVCGSNNLLIADGGALRQIDHGIVDMSTLNPDVMAYAFNRLSVLSENAPTATEMPIAV